MISEKIYNYYLEKNGKEPFIGGALSAIFYWLVVDALCLALLIYPPYLSWTCNTALGKETFSKVIRALLAAFFNIFYLIIYALFWSGGCNAAKIRPKSRH